LDHIHKVEVKGGTMVAFDRKKKVTKGGTKLSADWTPYPERNDNPGMYGFSQLMNPRVEAKAAGLTRLQVCRGMAGGKGALYTGLTIHCAHHTLYSYTMH
jgi:hypothetical protein